MDRLAVVLKPYLILTLVMFASFSSAGTESEAKALLLFEANIYRTLGDMSDYVLKEKDGNKLQALEQTIAQGDQLVSGFDSRWPMVKEKWQQMISFMRTDLIEADNSDNVKFPRRYEVVQLALTEAVTQAREQIALTEISAVERPLLMALIRLEQMVGGYTFYNINVFGGFSVPDTGIEDYAAMFSQEIDKLQQVNPKLANKLQRKWRFIEKTVLDYNKTSAVFIVRRTADSLRSMANSGLQAKQLAAE